MNEAGGPSTAELERRFERHLLEDMSELRSRYDPHLFKRMVAQHGAVETARRLLADPRHTSYGFEKLWELGELERSMEFAVLLPWFRPLFTDEELSEAERRLLLHDFRLGERLVARSGSPPAWAEEP